MYGITLVAAAILGLPLGVLAYGQRASNAVARVLLSRFALAAAGLILSITVIGDHLAPERRETGLGWPGQVLSLLIVTANLGSGMLEWRRLIRKESEEETPKTFD